MFTIDLANTIFVICVAVTIAAGRSGSVLLSYGGTTHDMTATADVDVPAGTLVTVTDVAGGLTGLDVPGRGRQN